MKCIACYPFQRVFNGRLNRNKKRKEQMALFAFVNTFMWFYFA